MFLTIHGAIGIIIGQNIKNPFWAFILGLISHYILDIIPHGDTRVFKKYKNLIHLGVAAIIDFIILFIFLIALSYQSGFLKTNVLSVVFGSILPDLLQALYYLSNKKLFKRCQKVHNFFHGLISPKFELNFLLGIIIQIIIFIFLTFKIF